MKKSILIFLGLCLSSIIFGQTINFQLGASFSKLNWEVGYLSSERSKEPLKNYTAFIGIEYFNKQHFNLSTNIGYIQKGGTSATTIRSQGYPVAATFNTWAILDFVTFNTSVDVRIPIKENLRPFLSHGPRIDFLVNRNDVFDLINEAEEFRNIAFGYNLGAGVKYKLSKFQLGLRTDYYVNFTKIAEWEAKDQRRDGRIWDDTYTINLFFGYRLKGN